MKTFTPEVATLQSRNAVPAASLSSGEHGMQDLASNLKKFFSQMLETVGRSGHRWYR